MKCLIDLNNLKTHWGAGQTMIPFECECCHKTFYKKQKYVINSIKKNESINSCSIRCMGLNRTTKKIVKCKQCNKNFRKTPARIKKFPNHFCSSSCAATYNNTHKTKGYRRSKLEVWLEKELPILYPKLKFKFNCKEDINSELDIFIPELKLAFELNGIFHYEPIFGKDKLNQVKNNDSRKFQACLEKEIELCIIDTSKLVHFKIDKAKVFLDIIVNIINNKLVSLVGHDPTT